jgi:hypothetical protein
LITLDPVTPPAVPANVRLCVNLYQSNGIWDNFPWLRGIPLEQEPGATGKLFNFNVRTDRTDLLDPDVNHFNIEKKEKIHAEVIRLLLAVCPTRQEWTEWREGRPTERARVASSIRIRPAPAAAPGGPIFTASVAHESSN